MIHRDIKLGNVLIGEDHEPKICDFGFAKMTKSKKEVTQSILGTPVTMAPEIYLGLEYDNKVDIWSFGVVIYKMVYGKYPFST